MPNPMNIYLHSTSAKELFNRSRRDLSHGCTRVEHPAELAQFVLADPLER
jgi:murein L,D-transpeptidase YcbB/YkuD